MFWDVSDLKPHGAFTTTHEFLEIKPIEQLVPVSSTLRSASTPGLSTS